MSHPYLKQRRGNTGRHSAFILIGRKEKAGNTSRPGCFHPAYCFSVGEGVTSSGNTTCQCRCL